MNEPTEHDKDFLLRYCDEHLAEHGDTAMGAAWPNEKDRQTRFAVMLDVLQRRTETPVVLCDLACGTGELLAHIRSRGIEGIRYIGVDRSERALSFARAKFPDETFLEMDVNAPDADLERIECDYLVANGLFTVKRELTQGQMWSFLENTVRNVWPHVRRGIAFNVMSKVVDWEREDLFHVPMDDLARLLHGLAGRRVRMRADYGLYEYTAFAFKEDPAIIPAAPAEPEAAPGTAPVPVLRPRLPVAGLLVPYLRRIDAKRTYSNHGPLATELAARLSARLGLPSGSVACTSSGTASLIGAVLAVAGRATPARPLAVLPAFTFVATASALEQCGYRGFLADIDPETWMLDADRLMSHPELPRVGVVVPVAPFGRPVPQDPWRRFREKTGIPVVIDGAASLDCIVRSPGGFLGDVPVAMSFHATKSYSTGEGGAVVSASSAQTKLVTQALNFGFYESRDCAVPSTNGKMSEYHAAVGLAELDSWAEKQALLRAVADGYRARLGEGDLRERFFATPDISASYAVFHCRDAAENERVQAALRRRAVDFRLWYGTGVQDQSYFSDLPRESLAVTEKLAPRLLGLPVAPDLSEADLDRVVAGVRDGAGSRS